MAESIPGLNYTLDMLKETCYLSRFDDDRKIGPENKKKSVKNF